METVIEEKMKELDIEYYYIYDYYNVDPNNYHHKSVNLSNKDNLFFKKAPFGIWAESDIFISKVKDISLFYINKIKNTKVRETAKISRILKFNETFPDAQSLIKNLEIEYENIPVSVIIPLVIKTYTIFTDKTTGS